jgi:CRISPR-associated endonuclease/helicase Cas3
LVIVKTVERAVAVYDALTRRKTGVEVLLLHSRFRSAERERQRERLGEPLPPDGRIIVSTQVIEAGVDIDARHLVTELAPWASLVQRFGRCNRAGIQQDAAVRWVDMEEDEKLALPYRPEELLAARQVIESCEDVAPTLLPQVKLPYSPRMVLRKKDLIELFDTTPDLAGADIDVSPFIRDTDNHDVQVFWRAGLGDDPPPDVPSPGRQELCPVPVGDFRSWLKNQAAWRWDALEKSWTSIRPSEIHPGLLILLKAEGGGYAPARGWSPDNKDDVADLHAGSSAPEQGFDDNAECEARWATIDEHTQRVVAELQLILARVSLQPDHRRDLEEAALWHDLGKAHPVFQATMLGDPPENDVSVLWAKTVRRGARHSRKGFRHELASGLGLLLNGRSDLVAYLAAAHHGRVRLAIRSFPTEDLPRDETGRVQPDRRFALGLWDGESLPAVLLGEDQSMPETLIDLSLMELGDGLRGASWIARMTALRDSLGPFRMAFLEALLRAADQRGSQVLS